MSLLRAEYIEKHLKEAAGKGRAGEGRNGVGRRKIVAVDHEG